MARTAIRLAGPALVATGPTTIYTVPSDTKTNVQRAHVSNPGGGSAVTFTLSIGSDAAGTRVIASLSIPSGKTRDFGPYYMRENEILQVAASSNNVLNLTVDGLEYGIGLGPPDIGAHSSAFLAVGQAASEIVTPSMTTRASGSAVIACIGRGNNLNFALSGAPPSDNKGNPIYPQIGVMEPYVHPNEGSGTALYGLVGALGGSGTLVSALSGHTVDNNDDEVTLAVVEILRGRQIHDFAWNEISAQPPLFLPPTSETSGDVTTTGPAVLVAFWWGDGADCTSATPNNSFQILESITPGGSTIQCVMAAKVVSVPGTYNVTWTSVPDQGAQLWLVAVQ